MSRIRRKPSPFRELERQVRRLQWLAVVLAATIAILPPSIFAAFELSRLRMDTERNASHLAALVAAEASRNGGRVETLPALVDDAKVRGAFSSVVIVDADGHAVVRRGEPARSWVMARTTVPIRAAGSRLTTLTADGNAALLWQRSLRVLAIHLLIAGLLAVAVYRIPMRGLRRAIEEVQDTHSQLLHSDKLSAIGEMYAGLAHEINNPLGIVLVRVRLMLADAEQRGFAPELRRDLEMIERHGSRIADIVRSLLAFSRKAKFEATDTDVNAVLRDSVSLVERPFAKHGIDIDMQLDAALPHARASRHHLQQVFVNLLNNARDAMPDGGTVTLRTYASDGQVVAEVEDTGTGIAPEVAARIFEPFFTTKREGQGTGLGLSVSYGIVNAHGGDIEVDSAPGHGALFRVTLPVASRARA